MTQTTPQTTPDELSGNGKTPTMIPLNLSIIETLPADARDHVLWLHQHMIDQGMTIASAAESIGYDASTMHRVLRGNYAGSWPNVIAGIRSYRRLTGQRSEIQRAQFAENSISRLIWARLDWAMANESMAIIIGESGQGKSLAARAWRDKCAPGRTVMVEAPVLGGIAELMRYIAMGCGVKADTKHTRADSIQRAFNRDRMLIIDEAHRLLPGNMTSGRQANRLEILRWIHDTTGAAVVLIATQRFTDDLEAGSNAYQFEQLIGRAYTTRLPRKIGADAVRPLLQQYIGKPSAKLVQTACDLANERGRMRTLAKTLAVASRVAAKSGHEVSEEDVYRALAVERQLQGEVIAFNGKALK